MVFLRWDYTIAANGSPPSAAASFRLSTLNSGLSTIVIAGAGGEESEDGVELELW
jgi:hypothetical protein